MRISKKFISLLLAVLMVTALVPMAAVSASADDDTVDVDSFADLKQALENGKNAHVTATFATTQTDTLDLNGKTVTVDNGKYIAVYRNSLTIQDTVGGGKITNTSFPIVVMSAARLTLNSGTIESTDSVAVLFNSNSNANLFTMNGGKVSAATAAFQFQPSALSFDTTLTINDGIIEGNIAFHSAAGTYGFTNNVKVTGGQFDVDKLIVENKTASIQPNITGGKFKCEVTSEDLGASDPELQADGYYHCIPNASYIYNYASLKAALNTTGNYKVTHDVAAQNSVYADKDVEVTIDGNNKTYVANPNYAAERAIYVRSLHIKLDIKDFNFDGNNKSKSIIFNNCDLDNGDNNDSSYTLTNCIFKNVRSDGYGAVHTKGYQSITVDNCTFTGNTSTDSDGASDLFLATAVNATIKDSSLNGSVFCHVEGSRSDSEKLEITGSTIGSIYLEENGNTPETNDFYSYAITKFENSTVKEIVVENPGTTEEDLDKILCRDATTHDNEGGVYIAKDTSGNVIDKTTTLYNEYQFKSMADENIVGMLGNEFKLGDDITVTNGIGNLGSGGQYDFTIDLNGHVATIRSGQSHLSRSRMFQEPTINDSVGGGGITTDGSTFAVGNSQKLTINGGTFTSDYHNGIVYMYDRTGTVTINDGTFVYPTDKSVVGGSVANNFTIYGGTFSNNVYEYITKEADATFNIRQADGSNKTYTTKEALGYNMSKEAGDTAKDWAAIPANCFKNLQMVGIQKKNLAATAAKADGNEYQTKGVRFVTLVNEGLLKSANIADYGYVVAKVSGKTQEGIGDKFANLKCDGSNGEKTISCLGSSNSLSGDYGLYDKSTTYKYVTLAVNGMRDGEQAVARFYIKTTDGKIYYADYTNDNNVVYSGMLATY